MSKQQHTPAPWRASRIQNDRWYYIVGPKGNVIGFPDSDEMGQEEHRANSMLMAASPDLLDVLRDMIANSEPHDNDEAFAVRERAKKIVAKATGQTEPHTD